MLIHRRNQKGIYAKAQMTGNRNETKSWGVTWLACQSTKGRARFNGIPNTVISINRMRNEKKMCGKLPGGKTAVSTTTVSGAGFDGGVSF